MESRRWTSDVLVVGGGIAAVYAACKAKELGADVLLVDKSHLGRSGCTALASGVNHYYESGDDVEVWLRGESNPMTNQKLFQQNLQRTHEVQQFLEQAGVKFIKDGQKVLRVGGARMSHPHSAMMAEGGPQMGIALRAEALRRGVRVLNRVMITGLLTSDGELPTGGRVVGAVGFDTRTGETHVFQAPAVIMCTGPYGIPFNRYEPSFRTRGMPINASGEGVYAMWEAGAVLGKLELGYRTPAPAEFPTAPALEMLTALGGHTIWMNGKGERFLSEEFRRKEWGRSSVTMSIMAEYLAGRGPVGINVSHLTPEQRRLLKQVVPIVFGNFEAAGYDLTKDTVPYTVGAPAVQGVNGAGARVNARGETSVPGLYAAGNCSDGAYVCLGQALYVCALTGWWAGESAAEYARSGSPSVVDAGQISSHENRYRAPIGVQGGLTFDEVRDQVTDLHLRLTPTLNADNMGYAIGRLDSLIAESLPRLAAADPRALAKVGALKASLPVMRVALQVMAHRTESRGNVLRDDHPYTDNDTWLVHTVVQRVAGGDSRLWDIPIPEEWWLYPPAPGRALHPYFEGVKA